MPISAVETPNAQLWTRQQSAEMKTFTFDCRLISSFSLSLPLSTKVKKIYKELHIPKLYQRYETDFYEEIKTHIQQISGAKVGSGERVGRICSPAPIRADFFSTVWRIFHLKVSQNLS